MRTYGYDYAFAISVDEVNRLLHDSMAKQDVELRYAAKDDTTGAEITLDATTAPWQIVPGSQNTLLRLAIPFASGRLEIGSPLEKKYDLASVRVVVEVSLGWLGASDGQDSHGSGDRTRLVFSPTQTGDPTSTGYVSAVAVVDPDGALDSVGVAVLKAYMADLLVENRKNLKLVFASVFPVPAHLRSWLRPAKWIYYYSGAGHHDALCFLCMLGETPWPKTPAFDSTALRSGHDATVLISQEAVFRHVVLPAIDGAFDHGRFTLHVDGESCTVKSSGPISVKTEKGSIEATSFALQADDAGNGFEITASGGGPLKFFFGVAKLPNASYSWSIATRNPVHYADRRLTFSRDPHPTIHHHQRIYWYDWVLLVVTGITSLGGLIAVIVDAIESFSSVANRVGMERVTRALADSIDDSVVNLANLVGWKVDDQAFTPADAGLAGALYVVGDLK